MSKRQSSLDESSSSSVSKSDSSDSMSCQKHFQQIGLPHSDDRLVSGNGARKVESCSSDLDEDENLAFKADNPISSPVVLGKYGLFTLVKKNAVFPKVQSVLPCDAFSASAKETEFVDFSCSNDAGSSSTENSVRKTGDENGFFETPAPGMQSTEFNIIDQSQLGQGSASTEDSNEDLLDSLFPKSTNECTTHEQHTEESASTVERKKFLREAAIDLNRQLYHSYLSLIRDLEESLRVNLEKQEELSTSIEFLKLTEQENNRAQRPPEMVLDSYFIESLALEGVGIQMPDKRHWLDYNYS